MSLLECRASPTTTCMMPHLWLRPDPKNRAVAQLFFLTTRPPRPLPMPMPACCSNNFGVGLTRGGLFDEKKLNVGSALPQTEADPPSRARGHLVGRGAARVRAIPPSLSPFFGLVRLLISRAGLGACAGPDVCVVWPSSLTAPGCLPVARVCLL